MESAATIQRVSSKQFFGCLLACLMPIAFLFLLVAWWAYSPGQDHPASISLDGDGSWYRNYEIGNEIQDHDIFYHGIGHSIENAQQADIIFLGNSRLIFGLDWRLFEAFERKHRLKLFNMAFAGIRGGDFALQIIRKWSLRPKMWVINLDRDPKNDRIGFFSTGLVSPDAFGASATLSVVNSTRMQAFGRVVSRNIRWRLKMMAGLFKEHNPYRSANTGNWYIDTWPNHASDRNAPIKLLQLNHPDGNVRQMERLDSSCSRLPEEQENAEHYINAIGGTVILIQVPNAFACDPQIHELAAGLAVPAFVLDSTQFTSNDGGGHLDQVSARKYSDMLFAWLEGLPEFQRLFSGNDPHSGGTH
jgi:hypothetical protein